MWGDGLRINFDSIKPIYVQVAEAIEDDIVSGKLTEGEPVYSQLVLSRELGINPATAAKGINLLVQNGVLEKQRGVSMIVASGAKERIIGGKKQQEFSDTVALLIEQAGKIGLSKSQVLAKIQEAYSQGGNQDE